jgi:O-antigen ligase
MPFVKVGAIRSFGPVIQLADLVFALVAGLWLLGIARGELELVVGKAWIGLGFYVVASAASFFVSPEPKTSAIKLIGLGFLVTLALVTASLAATRAGWKVVVGAWALAAGITGLLGTLSVLVFFAGVRDRAVNIFLWSYGSIPAGGYPRIAIFFLNSNMLCSYLLVGIAASVLMLRESEGRWRQIWWALLGAMTISTVFTLSAGLGGLGLGAGVGWIWWQRYRKSVVAWREALVGLGAAAGALVFIVLSVFLLVPPGQGDVGLGLADLELQGSGRVANWKGAIDAIVEKPVTGHGIGLNIALTRHPRAFHSMEEWGTTAMQDMVARPMEAHNVLLNIWGQIGVFGALGFVLFVGALLFGLLAREARDESSQWVRITLVCALLAAVLYHGLFGGFEESRQYWWLFGVTLAALHHRQSNEARARCAA